MRISIPIGYSWDRHIGLDFDPDRRLQEVIRLVFQKFRELGSARQVLLWMASQNIHFPYPSDGRTLTSFEWRPIRYRNVISILKNPFYAGVYAYREPPNLGGTEPGMLRCHIAARSRGYYTLTITIYRSVTTIVHQPVLCHKLRLTVGGRRRLKNPLSHRK